MLPISKLATTLQVARPSKDEHEKSLNEHQGKINLLETKRDNVTAQIEKFDKIRKASPIGEARAKFATLKNAKNKVQNERKALFDRQDSIRKVTDGLIKTQNDAKKEIKYTSVDQIDKAMKRLREKQETTSMKLSEEKILIKVRHEHCERRNARSGATARSEAANNIATSRRFAPR